jgi:hypothetical protein
LLYTLYKYIIFCAGHIEYMARTVLGNQYAGVTSSNPPQNAYVYSRVLLLC